MYADHDGAINQLLREMDAIARVNDDLRARLAAVLAVPACRDAGHVETLHSAAGCCDPYETPCAAYGASMGAAASISEHPARPLLKEARMQEVDARPAELQPTSNNGLELELGDRLADGTYATDHAGHGCSVDPFRDRP